MITPSYGISTGYVLPRLALDFTTASLDSRVSVTRALNTATRIGSNGYIQTVNADTPRFDYDPISLVCKGLLIEEARANLFTYSGAFSNGAWGLFGGASRSASTDISPSGTTDAWNLTFGAGVTSSLYRTASLGLASNTYTFSCYIKSSTSGTCRLNIYNGLDDITTANLAVTSVWTRFSMTYTGPVQNVSIINSSLGGANAIQIYGAQLEAGAFVTSYIPTTSTSLTRNADQVAMTGTNFSDWYNATEGTLSFEGSIFVDQGSTTVDFIQISNGVSNAISIDLAMFGVAVPFFSVGNSGSQCNIDTGTLTLNTVFKMVGAYKANSFAAALNGGTPGTDSAGTIPTVSQMGIGNRLSGPYMNGHARKFAYWPQRLINAEVQAFSK